MTLFEWEAPGPYRGPVIYMGTTSKELAPGFRVGWVIAAGVVGFAGNEAVALYRIRVGQRIGSAALVADGVHALEHVEQVTAVERVRLRWIGHRLHGDALVRTGEVTLAEANRISAAAETAVTQHVPKVDEITVHALAPEPGRTPA